MSDSESGSKSHQRIVDEFIEKLANSQQDLPPEFAKVVDDYFWELSL